MGCVVQFKKVATLPPLAFGRGHLTTAATPVAPSGSRLRNHTWRTYWLAFLAGPLVTAWLTAEGALIAHGSETTQIPAAADAVSAVPIRDVSPEIWPTHGWATSTPEAQGIDSNAIAAALAAIRAHHVPIDSLLIERHGYIVLDEYFHPFAADRLHITTSVTKSIVSTLAGIVLGGSWPIGLNEPAIAILSEWKMADGDPRKARITLARLLGMTSGLDCGAPQGPGILGAMERSRHWADFVLGRPLAAEPGSTFSYCGGNYQVVSAVLTQLTGMSAFAFARRELFGPLGITHANWSTDKDDVSHGFSDLGLEPRDMAKLGYLWLHGGRWEGRQIVPADYLAAALTPRARVVPGIEYGYGFWIYRNRDEPDFEANGIGGQRIAVIPGLDMVEVITGHGLDANVITDLLAAIVNRNTDVAKNQVGEAQRVLPAGTIAPVKKPFDIERP
jgi:CubicO group peptidase (beta-lactamase class C family)